MDDSDNLLLAQLRSRVGTLLRGKWRVDALLGVGGMAAVYAATHRNGHRCAIKMLLPSVSASADATQRFSKEGYVANKVNHPGVAIVLDDDVTEDGAPFLVMELLQGESFDRVLSRSVRGASIDCFEVMRVAFEVLDVLVVAHALGIVHRDIKPENVFVLPDGRIKVLDFGIARMADATHGTRTQHGAVMGTPAYMPPEQARGHWEEVDGQSDLWSVGAMMFVALAKRPLREAPTPNERLLLAMTEPLPPLRSVAPSVPFPVADIVDRALLLDKRSRWPDARAMQVALGSALGKELSVVSLPLAPTTHEPVATDAMLTATRSEPRAAPVAPLPGRAFVPWRRRAVLGLSSLVVVAVAWVATRSLGPGRVPPSAPASESPALGIPEAASTPSGADSTALSASASASPVAPSASPAPVAPVKRRRARDAGAAPPAPTPGDDPLNRRL